VCDESDHVDVEPTVSGDMGQNFHDAPDDITLFYRSMQE
jgi:hypothetical protein